MQLKELVSLMSRKIEFADANGKVYIDWIPTYYILL